MLEADATHDLVVTSIVGDIVLHVPNSVVNGVIPSKELITKGHVVTSATSTIEDVDEWELT